MCKGRYENIHIIAIFAAIASGAITGIVIAQTPTQGAPGWLLLCTLGLIGLAIPSSRDFSRRVVNVTVAMSGITPLLWWIRFPAPQLRSAILWAIVVGIFVGCIAEWIRSRRPWREFFPGWNVVDSYPVLTGIFALGSFWNFFVPKSAIGTLSMLATAWDFAPHFNIYAILRRYSIVIPLAPLPPDGSGWTAVTYPQGVHALMATLAEVVGGPNFSTNDA